jgi:hypothetical protein
MNDTKKNDYRDILTEEEIARARSMTNDQILEEGVYTIIEIAKDNGLTDDEADDIVRRVLDARVRSRFKVLK